MSNEWKERRKKKNTKILSSFSKGKEPNILPII